MDLETLSGVVAEHVDAVNARDEEAIVATFAADALVNDARREFWGSDAIRAWVAKEMVGDHVTIEVVEVVDHRGLIVVRGRYDGDFDKTNLPEELILTNYFTVSAGRIDSLIVIRNTTDGDVRGIGPHVGSSPVADATSRANGR